VSPIYLFSRPNHWVKQATSILLNDMNQEKQGRIPMKHVPLYIISYAIY
jgi:hypothetical protein